MLRYAFLTAFPITINKPEILKWIWFESLETINKAMQFVFPSPVTMVKSLLGNQMSKLFFQNITATAVWWNVAMACRMVNFGEMNTEWSTGKNYGFWVMWGIFKEYIKQNIIMAVLRKANFHSVAICRLIKKSNTVKDDPRRKTDFQSLVFLKLPSAYEGLIRSKVM